MEKKRFYPPALFSGSTLKLLAMLSMILDHIGAVIIEKGYLYLYNQQLARALPYEETYALLHLDYILRAAGRIAFPLFCFLLVEGFYHTQDRKAYAFRLFLLALIAEVPFDLAFRSALMDVSYQNVMFTLLIGLLTLMALERFRFRPLLWPPVIALGMGLACLLHTDYAWQGVLLIVVMYLFRSWPLVQTIAGCLVMYNSWMAWAAFIPLNLYNGKRGLSLKYIFYWFYPVHLLLLTGIRWILCGI